MIGAHVKVSINGANDKKNEWPYSSSPSELPLPILFLN